jgi:hypothetical protein
MFKKITLSFAILLAGITAKSQCTVGASGSAPGAYPSSLTDGCVGSAYDETTTLVFPLDTVIPSFGTIPLDSAVITGVNNLPAGTTAETFCGGFTCLALPGGPTTSAKSCIKITGTPTAAFNDSIEIMFTLYATLPIVGPQAFPTSKKVAVTINSVDNTTAIAGLTITANETGATYEWLDCNNSNIAISPAETGISYTATTNGNYAVEVTKNGCVDTSACVTIATVSVIENNFSNAVKLFPNPTEGSVNLTLNKAYENISINVTDIAGKTVLNRVYTNSNNINFNIDNKSGVYFVEVSSNNEKAIFKVIKK